MRWIETTHPFYIVQKRPNFWNNEQIVVLSRADYRILKKKKLIRKKQNKKWVYEKKNWNSKNL